MGCSPKVTSRPCHVSTRGMKDDDGCCWCSLASKEAWPLVSENQPTNQPRNAPPTPASNNSLSSSDFSHEKAPQQLREFLTKNKAKVRCLSLPPRELPPKLMNSVAAALTISASDPGTQVRLLLSPPKHPPRFPNNNVRFFWFLYLFWGARGYQLFQICSQERASERASEGAGREGGRRVRSHVWKQRPSPLSQRESPKEAWPSRVRDVGQVK